MLQYVFLVDLHIVSQADSPIVIDASAPLAGIVYDGELLQEDLQFTRYTNKVSVFYFVLLN